MDEAMAPILAAGGAPSRRSGSTLRAIFRIASRPAALTVGLALVICIIIAVRKFEFLFEASINQWADYASNDILIMEAKHFSLFHGNYSRVVPIPLSC